MAYASRSGRARTSAKSPIPFAVCMRCGIWYNRTDLNFQFEWRGASLQNTYILVCRPCTDIPQEQNRAITLPADPTPIFYPSVEDFDAAESDYRSLSAPTVYDPNTGIPIPDTVLRVTEDCQNRTLYPFGIPVGFDQNAVMPYNGAIQKEFGVPLNILSVISDGSATVQVTCSSVHGLQSNSQVSIRGLLNSAADGFYSVTVLTATAFTYMTYGSISASSLLTPTSRIITALVGLPRGYDVIPKIFGPPLIGDVNTPICYLETENGTGQFLLEDGSGYIALESCYHPPTGTYYFDLETGTGSILLEDGSTFLELEIGP
jgi:hypothetical protein